MPMADDFTDLNKFGRIFAYGVEKSKKTWWACRAAEAGYNVLLLDGDDGAHIVQQLPMEARRRILIVDVVNTTTRAVFTAFLAMFCRPGNKFVWDEQTKAASPVMRDTTHSFIEFDASKFGDNDVIILDSWTALAFSTRFQYALEHKIDMTKADRTDWDGFGFEDRFLDYIVNFIHTVPCHVIVIGHSTIYEKRSKDQKTVVSQTTQPISSTGPNAKKLGKHFADILYFEKYGDQIQINTAGDTDRVGGSRNIAPSRIKWEDLAPQDIFAKLGYKGDPSKPMLGAKWLRRGTVQEAPGARPTIGIAATIAAPAQNSPVTPAGNATSSSEAPVVQGGMLARLKLQAKSR